jgi:ribosome-binding protein aMBF1 (putative translation factor)
MRAQWRVPVAPSAAPPLPLDPGSSDPNYTPSLQKCQVSQKTVGKIRCMLGANLRDWRRARGFSQRALAARVGISTRMLARYERGERYPDGKTLHALADALNISLSTLFTPRRITQITLTHCCKLFD